VDTLFRSMLLAARADTIALLLTGMGDDGAHAMLDLQRAGACTIAQDEATSIVFGMPRQAIELGAAQEILPLSAIGPRIRELARSRARTSSFGNL
jgi:two-component system chemotaxis response regulator CheB